MGLFFTYPELLIATFLAVCAVSSFAWWLRGIVLRESLAVAEQKYEAARREAELLKQKAEVLERENTALRAQIPEAKEVVLSDDTQRVLVHLFKTTQPEAQGVGTMAMALGMTAFVMPVWL